MPDVIIKGMEMPENCADCPIEADDFDECPFMHVHPIREAVEKRLGHRVIGWRCNYDKRPDWCPLRPAPEVVRCRECAHRDPEDKKCDCGHDILWQLPRGDDWFCADGKRKKEGTP